MDQRRTGCRKANRLIDKYSDRLPTLLACTSREVKGDAKVMSPLNTIEMVTIMNAEVQNARSQFRESTPDIPSGEGRVMRFTRELVWRWKAGHYTYRESDFAEPLAM